MIHLMHRWKPRYVEHFRYRWSRLPVTVVFQRCSVCKKTKSKELEGHWELEDLT